MREGLRERTGRDVGVIVSDSFGRPWRQGTTDVAIGVAGLTPLLDLRGVRDSVGYELQATQIAVADELAGAAELVIGKTNGIPAAIIRGLDVRGDGHRPRHRHPGRARPLPLERFDCERGEPLPITGANLKPCPLHGDPITTRPVRSSRNSSFSLFV